MVDTPTTVTSIESLISKCLAQAAAEHGVEHVFIGFSGGADSTALLAATASVVTSHFPTLGVSAIHVNHGLQADAERWQAHCEGVCAQLGVAFKPCRIAITHTGNVEANARELRYRVFEEHLKDGGLLLLGHHQYDQTETILYRLFQGRGLLPMRTQGVIGAGCFARPLLTVSPGQLRQYLVSLGLSWVEDQSNTDVRFERNFLRRDVLPQLSQRWQQLHQGLQRVVGAQAGVQAALVHELTQLGSQVALSHLPGGDARLAWLRAYLHSRGVFRVADKALQEFAQQLDTSSTAELRCETRTSLHLYNECLYFVSRSDDARDSPSNEPCYLELGETLTLFAGSLSLCEGDALQPLGFCYTQALQVRFRQGGERMEFAQFSKPLKQLFNEAKVPPWRRSSYPLLYVGEDLVCVPGIAVAANYVCGPQTPTGKVCVAQWQPADV